MANLMIQKKVEAYLVDALECGMKLNLSSDAFIDENHLDCVFYGGYIGDFEYGKAKLVISVIGDVRIDGEYKGEEIHYRDKNNDGAMAANDDSIRRLFGSDAELLKALEDGQIVYNNNSWIEATLFAEDGTMIYSDVVDSTDNVLEVFSGAADWLEGTIKPCLKQYHEKG